MRNRHPDPAQGRRPRLAPRKPDEDFFAADDEDDSDPNDAPVERNGRHGGRHNTDGRPSKSPATATVPPANAKAVRHLLDDDDDDHDGEHLEANRRSLANPSSRSCDAPDDGDGDDGEIGSAAKPESEFVGSEYQRRPDNKLRGIFVPDWVMEVTSNCAERLVLAQLAYWFGTKSTKHPSRARVKRNDHYWVAKTHSELGREVGLGAREVRYVVDKLRKKRLIETEVRFFGPRRSIHLRLRADVIAQIAGRASRVEHVADDDLV